MRYKWLNRLLQKWLKKIGEVVSKETILEYQQLIRKVPVTDNVLEYAVNSGS